VKQAISHRDEKELLQTEIKQLKEEGRLSEQMIREMKSNEFVASTGNESQKNQDLMNSIRDLSDVVLKLDDKTTRLSDEMTGRQERLLTAAVVENAQKQLDGKIDTVFEQTRGLLRDVSAELDSFRSMVNREHNMNTSREANKSTPVSQEPNNRSQSPVRSTGFEAKISEIQSSLERLEDNMQQQELQILLGARPQYQPATTGATGTGMGGLLFANYLSALVPERNPQSLFVQTLLQMQTSQPMQINGSGQCNPYQYHALASGQPSSFHSTKSSLQKQIANLKGELGLFTPNFNLYDVEQ
jgi:hypothetical protein